jgi:amino acid adenylation domain-containing protein
LSTTIANTRDFALLHQAVEYYGASNPGHLAIDEGRRTITYGMLRESMERVAAVLLGNGLVRNSRVALYLENGIDACIAMLGVLRSGGCYVPLLPGSPAPRNATIIRDARPFAIITTRQHLPRLLDVAPQLRTEPVPLLIVLDMDAGEIGTSGSLPTLRAGFGSVAGRDALEAAAIPPPAVEMIEEDLAYILFTSGTTGQPKGVMLSHRNVTSFLRWSVVYFGLTPRDRLSNHSSICFDVSVFDIFGSFFAGATLCPVMAPGDRAYPARFIKDRRITVWFSVPSVLGLIRSTRQLTENAFAEHLRAIIFAGEPIAPDYVASWLATHPQVPIFNLYGPTEAAISVTHHRVGEEVPFDPARPVPIGRPMRDVEILILRLDSDELAEVGETGRLMICGTQVSPGYWRRPELTAAAFQLNPFKREFGARMYDSGDLAYKDARGVVHYVGRRDSQVKFMGFRIELGDIDVALGGAEQVDEAAAVLIEGDSPMLIGAVAVSGDGGDPEERILVHCESVLPKYMVPQRVVVFPSLPRNANGKIDRKAIQEAVLARLAQDDRTDL